MAILQQRKQPPGSGNIVSDVLDSARVAKRKLPSTPTATTPPVAPSTPPVAPNTPTPPLTPPPATPPAVTPADYSGDPTLQEIKRVQGDAYNQTSSGIDDQIRQLLIATGLKGVAASQLGADSPFLASITDDPSGVSKASQLNRRYKDLGRQNEESFNDQGLFFSGARVKNLSDTAHQKVVDQNDLSNQLLQALATLHDAQIGAKRSRDTAVIQAEQDARDRAIELALKYGIGNPGGGPGADATGTYASLGATPQPITSDLVAPPVPFGGKELPAQTGADLQLQLALNAAKKKTAAAGGGGRSLAA